MAAFTGPRGWMVRCRYLGEHFWWRLGGRFQMTLTRDRWESIYLPGVGVCEGPGKSSRWEDGALRPGCGLQEPERPPAGLGTPGPQA